METITLSITGHTNAGKTALGRTLLSRDIGEVRDAPHVTTSVEIHEWIKTDECVVRLADTPGFDSAERLLKRMRQAESPVGWFLREVWDRMLDPGFYLTQLALRQVAQSTDVVLHVVDLAAEHEGPTARSLAEIELLSLIRTPVIVVLNQTGRAWTHAEASREEARWREVLANQQAVRDIMILDAFTRCWPGELILLQNVARQLPDDKKAAIDSARRELCRRHLDVFARSARALAELLHATATDGESMEKLGLLGNARRVVARLFSGTEDQRTLEEAHKRLRNRVAERSVGYLNTIIDLHGISGHGERHLLEEDAAAFSGGERSRLMWRELGLAAAGGAAAGGVVDAAVGGASFMAGAAVGALFGTLTAIGLGARGLAADERGRVVWKPEAVLRLAAVGIRTYLAVAHFGRGQGSWRDHDGPEFWAHVIDEVAHGSREAMLDALSRGPEALEAELAVVMEAVLRRLYPSAPWTEITTAREA